MTEPIMSSTALAYNGALIRDRNEMLSLTDMWRAAGADDNKAPKYWLRQAGTAEFVNYISGLQNVTEDHLFQVGQGRGGGTWAHWQIAMAYAKYLSPEFHAWCNEVVRAHMEGRLAANAGATIEAIVAAVAARLDAKISGMVEARLSADPRTAVRSHLSVKELLEEWKVPSRHRNSLNRRVGAMLRASASKNAAVEALQCRRTNTWLFPAGWARDFVRQHCAPMIQEHCDDVVGQGVLQFPKRQRRKHSSPVDISEMAAPADG